MKRQDKIARLLIPLGVGALLAVAWGLAAWRRTEAIQAHVAQALRSAGQGQVEVAEAQWREAIRLDPNNARLYEMVGQYEMNSSRWAQAADAFRSLARVAPETPHVYCRLAACLLRQDDQKGAFETANTELKHDPNCVAALGLVTSVMVLQPASDAKLRLEYMRRLARLAPADLDFLHMYAEELANGYRYDELRTVVANILKRDSRDAEAFNLLGYADLASPNQPAGVEQAVRDFNASLAINPANGGAHFGLGRAALRLGRAPEAVAHLELALQMRPDAARINYELSNAYRMAGQTKRAEEARSRYVAWQRVSEQRRQLQVRCIAYPKDPQYPRQLGLLLARNNGDAGEAVYYLKKAEQLAPGDPDVRSELGRLQGQGSPTALSPEKVAAASGATPFR
jgi:Flp pilus assembly protein TadD